MTTERTKGTLPISVGTALAIEALSGKPIYKYSTFLINLRTIVRNARQAYDQYTPTVNELTQACKEDIIGIAEGIIALKLVSPLDIKFYYPSYKNLPKLFPLAKLKDVTKQGTDKQKEIANLEEKVIDKLLPEFGKAISQVNSVIPEFAGRGLILTGHPVDLVTTKSYARLFLLESQQNIFECAH